MQNLQELYDAFLETRPSNGKIKTATTMMIHVCKALDIPSQEEITQDMFAELPQTLDNYFFNYPLKSTQDKAILAEMIGRVGPSEELRGMLERLLGDKDENVRQYSLHTLEYFGKINPPVILEYIEKYRTGEDPVMHTMAAHITGSICSSPKCREVLDQVEKWVSEGDERFSRDVLRRLIYIRKQNTSKEEYFNMEELRAWALRVFGPEIENYF
jgi:hypothetical protein